ncbi:MAG: hypothetical protein CMG66_03350 [Candidatus Marinimicrobia bacterium]|nr:hypothetical protein [Candidatus Neomarinimicrobiota bacterium]|tara:strand:- start:14356 stop:15438 length:1083 start_codon:yes stop_codon:yes gene_type:complete
MNKIDKFIIVFLFFIFSASSLSGQIYKPNSFSSSVIFGHDSNPLRLSEDEISQLSDKPYLLGSASDVYSRFIGLNAKFSFYSRKAILAKIFDRKTSFSFSVTYKKYFDNKEKNSQYFTFKINQQLDKYRRLHINYSLMPQYYIRQYEDLDYLISYGDIDDISRHYSCTFDMEKLYIIFQAPLSLIQNKVKVGAFYERQIFSPYFTEFDLNIAGQSIQFLFKGDNNYFNSNRTVSFLYEKHIGDNSTFLSEVFSANYMNRDYKQHRYKVSFNQTINSSKSFGFIIDTYKRFNTSKIVTDELHYKRKHTDLTLSIWYKKDRSKIMLSNRKRVARSPFGWVEELKSFDRYILTLTMTLANKKF